MKGETPPDAGCSLAALVRRHDPDRYMTALFAAPPHRAALFALYAFNYEIARVRETVSEPTLGLIRLQWWRETVDAAYEGGKVRRHAVAEALAATIREFAPTRAHLDRLIDTREQDLTGMPPPTLAALEDYAEGTASCLVYAALEVLGARAPAAMAAGRAVGLAYALTGMVRAIPFHVATGHCMIPRDVLARTGLDPADYGGMRARPALRAAVAELAGVAAAHLDEARRGCRDVPRTALPALLPAATAGRALIRLRQAGGDPFDPAVTRAEPLQVWRLGILRLLGRCC